jgi:uncharacterized ParB-like nuclease family protein
MSKSQRPKNQESKEQEIGLQESARPANLRANVVPVDGFVLTIDGKMKTRYASAEEANAAGAKLKNNYPVLQVAVYDATERAYTPVDAVDGSSTST